MANLAFKWISIHALREESDELSFDVLAVEDISIHALREESDQRILDAGLAMEFQSTLSVRRATC